MNTTSITTNAKTHVQAKPGRAICGATAAYEQMRPADLRDHVTCRRCRASLDVTERAMRAACDRKSGEAERS